jgi:hypothetical protein
MNEKPNLSITDIDRQGFKFLPMLETTEFLEFLKWLEMIRKEVNRIDKVIPSLKIDPSRDDIAGWGLSAVIIRSKTQMMEEIVIMCKNLKDKYKMFIEGE